MPSRAWSDAVHHWHVPHVHLPHLHLPRLSRERVNALRDGLIVLLCALLAAGLGWRLIAPSTGPLAPEPPAAARA